MNLNRIVIMFFGVTLFGLSGVFAQQLDSQLATEKFQKIDTNKDGFVTSDEMQTYQKVKFDKLDTDKNEALDQEELKEDKEQTFEKANKDSDEKISRQEACDQFNDYFNSMDANKDRRVSEDEFEEYWPINLRL